MNWDYIKTNWKFVLVAIVFAAFMLFGMLSNCAKASPGYSKTGSAPWCTFNGHHMNCSFYGVESCERTAAELNRYGGRYRCIANPR